MKLTWDIDSLCGRVLAGYDTLHNCGRCPSIDAIPFIDQQDFDRFTNQLFIGLDIPISILYMLSCGLVRYHHDYVEKYGHDPLVDRIVAVANNLKIATKLKSWSDALKERFDIDNDLFRPIENNEGRSTAAVLGDLVDNMKIMQKGLTYVIRTSATQERLNTEIVNRLEHHSEILEQLHGLNFTPTAVTNNNTQISRRRHQTTVDQSYSSTVDPSSSAAVNSSPSMKVCIESIKSISDVFYNWYKMQIYNYDYETTTINDRSKIKKLSKIIIYLRLFCASKILQDKPPEDDYEAMRQWVISLRAEATSVQDKFMAFLVAYFREHSDKQLSMCTVRKASVWTIEKLIKVIPLSLLPTTLCEDALTANASNAKHLFSGSSLSVLR